MTVDAAQYHEERRLHPSTLVQRLVVSLPGLALASLPLWRDPEGVPGSLFLLAFMAGVYLMVSVPLAVLRYLRFRYSITSKEIVIKSGVLTRQHRNIPLERVQNVEIRQPLIARIFRTARVQIETAGSNAAEGMIEFVSLREAHDIRRVVREYQRQGPAVAGIPAGEPELDESAIAEPRIENESTPLLRMPVSRVLLSGVYRFSLFYILIIFSGIQYVNVDPDEIADWFTGGRFEPVTRLIAESPWTLAFLGILLASLFSWTIGILVNLNRYFGFRLAREGDKLYRRHGLMTVLEGTIPLQKVQAVILRANAAMRHHGWLTLKLQTMGVNPDQRGHQVVVPFAKVDEIEGVTSEILPFDLPERFNSVSTITIRRMTIRYTVMLLAAAALGWLIYSELVWMLAAWPLLPLFAYLQYRNHGYAFDGRRLFVRRGVFVHHVWVLPVEKFQVLFSSASFFQRRLRLASLLVDMAGAATFPVPEVVDLPADEAGDVLQRLHLAMHEYGGVQRLAPLPFNDIP